MSCLILAIKKTLRWRETYKILSLEELEMWSRLVYWHGYDMKLRPCLIVRLGLACSSLASSDRPRFAQAIGMHSADFLFLQKFAFSQSRATYFPKMVDNKIW